MKIQHSVFASMLLLIAVACKQPLSSQDVLEKAISYHDPNSQWEQFNGELNITMETPDRPNRISDIKINLPEELFYVKATIDTLETVYDLNKTDCKVLFNGSSEFSEELAKANRLNCETARRYQNYYTYLYGLPMKLKDPGTHIADSVKHRNFKGKDYLVLKATYDEAVGTDIWYFYFDPESYAMEIYQFFRMDEEGNQKNDTGEYILLSEETTISGIKMPKIRAWYYNKDDVYLGTDILN